MLCRPLPDRERSARPSGPRVPPVPAGSGARVLPFVLPRWSRKIGDLCPCKSGGFGKTTLRHRALPGVVRGPMDHRARSGGLSGGGQRASPSAGPAGITPRLPGRCTGATDACAPVLPGHRAWGDAVLLPDAGQRPDPEGAFPGPSHPGPHPSGPGHVGPLLGLRDPWSGASQGRSGRALSAISGCRSAFGRPLRLWP